MLKIAVLLFSAMVFAATITNTAMADENLACMFTGTIDAQGSDVKGGTRITAIIEGDEYHTHTPLGDASSTYSIVILPSDGKSYPTGAEVAFKIDGHTVDQKAAFVPGASSNLNLVDVNNRLMQLGDGSIILPDTSSPSIETVYNWGLVTGLIFLTIAVLGLTYYFMLLRRIMTRQLTELQSKYFKQRKYSILSQKGILPAKSGNGGWKDNEAGKTGYTQM
ncbi:hypothetical protein ACFLXV_00645 [Chloroflexota bacterium]